MDKEENHTTEELKTEINRLRMQIATVSVSMEVFIKSNTITILVKVLMKLL